MMTPGNMIVAFLSELNRPVTNNPGMKKSLAVSLISTLSKITKKVSFGSQQSKEKV